MLLRPSLADEIGFLVFLVFGWSFIGLNTEYWPFSAGCYAAALFVAYYTVRKNWNLLKKKVLDVYVAHI